MPQSTYLTPQTSGTAITKKHDQMEVPDDPIAPFIGGGRTGANIGDDPPGRWRGQRS
jgi:hypothetical protein